VVVRCEVVEPYADRPTEGFFIFNTEFSPMASPSVEVGGRYVINSRAAWTAVVSADAAWLCVSAWRRWQGFGGGCRGGSVD
jgi:hypothetical protein